MKLCVIPARGGSKRIPRKNIREFCGKPMISWSIAAAKASGCFDQIIVSTDDAEIGDVARACGAEVPFMRPPDLSDDYVGTSPVVAHAVRWHQECGNEIAAVCCLYATAVFTEASDIRKGLRLLDKVTSDRFVFTATGYASPIQRALRLDPTSGETKMWTPEEYIKRSQDLEPAFHDAGQFYWGRPVAWLSNRNLFENSKPLILPRWRVQDIDSSEDWIRAELMHKALTQKTRKY